MHTPDYQPSPWVTEVPVRLATVTGRLADSRDRPGQQEMAALVAAAIDTGTTVAVQAGTGTGKSLAYLVPATASGKPTVVATATIALQDQLLNDDGPRLSPATVAVLKGRSNYLCRQRLAEGPGDDDTTSPGFWDRIHEWATSTEIGDRAELSAVTDRDWAAVSVSADECPGAKKCPAGENCCAELARHRAKNADVVIVNQALYGMHLALADNGVELLPNHDVLVVDEAHEFAGILRSSLGIRMTAGRLRTLARRMPLGHRPIVEGLLLAAEALDEILTRRAGQRVILEDDGELQRFLNVIISLTREALNALPEQMVEKTKLARVRRMADRISQDLAEFSFTSPEHHVLWVEASPPTLHLTPLDVSVALSRHVWPNRSVVLTSATLTPGVVGELNPPVESLHQVASPFDYANAGLLYCPEHLPAPSEAGWRTAVIDELCTLIPAVGGRTLALFSSRSAMSEAAAALRARFSYNAVAVQGEDSRERLVDLLRTRQCMVLCATMSFWQGVDIKGDAVSLVTIDRLPFPHPDDPVHIARRERAGQRGFATIDVPHVESLMAQAAGRLVRHENDRGVVAVMDTRLITKWKAYGRQVTQAMPAFRRTRDQDEAVSFLERLP